MVINSRDQWRTRGVRGALSGVWLLLILLSISSAQDEPSPFDKLDWKRGPLTGRLASIAEVSVPDGYQFLEGSDTRKMLELLQNPTSGDEVGLLTPLDEEQEWFVVFEFSDVGYVKDDEKNSLDADKMLAAIREGNDIANKERKKRGWSTIDVVGWVQPPRYDERTHNLAWAIRGQSPDGQSVNYNTRILGRHGVMEVALVADPDRLEFILPAFKNILLGFKFTSGNTYAEFRKGDRIAEYGLAALVTGGAAAVALKSGLLQKLWKVIVAVIIAVGIGIRKLFRRVVSGSTS